MGNNRRGDAVSGTRRRAFLAAVSVAGAGLLTGNRRAVNAATGLILLAVSLYYLLFVFEVAGSLA